MTFSTVAEAIDWTRDHWHAQRSAPTKLHTHVTEGVGLFYAPGFAAALDGSPEATVTVRIPDQPCYHPTLNRGDSPRSCPECFGLGVKEHRTDRYLYPMSRALARLAAVPPERRHPHPYALVHELVSCGWDPRRAAELAGIPWERYEPLLLIALRKLRARYEEGPSSTRTSASWIDKSDSQRAAEAAA